MGYSGIPGATLTGIAFVLPSFLMVLALAAVYVHFGQLAWIQGMLYWNRGGCKRCNFPKHLEAGSKNSRGRLPTLDFVQHLAATTLWTGSEIVWLFVLCGLIAMLVKAPPKPSAPVSAIFSASLAMGSVAPVSSKTLATIFLFFLKAGAFVFGSGLAIVPFLYGEVVGGFHWLTERQFLDAVAVAMITPGPVVITSGFIGFLVAGPLGACAATLAVFLPPYLLVIAGAPYYRRFAKNRKVKAFVQGVTAAAVGAIAGAAIILTRRAVMDLPTIMIALSVLILLLRFKQVPEPVIILGAGMVGFTVKHIWIS